MQFGAAFRSFFSRWIPHTIAWVTLVALCSSSAFWCTVLFFVLFCSFFFFFQAEDGIRDPLVTGVQTCALPIYPDRGVCQNHRRVRRVRPVRRERRRRPARAAGSLPPSAARRRALSRAMSASNPRSEERRVGKEGRSREGPDT